jgi:hypothetical protein
MTVTKREAEEGVASARSRPERIRYFGALLEKATGQETIIVGGSAIEIYTSGRTSSRDIDLVTARARAIEVVESWGFERTGRIWRRPDWDFDVDLVGPSLMGSHQKILVFDTPYGPARVAGVEDLLVKRLVELKHWPTSPAWRESLVTQVEILLSEFRDKLDEEYLAFIARRDDVVDLLSDFQRRRPTVDR